MQINYDIQTSILDAIKNSLDPSASLADELADCLSVSKDSAYRRIRGETLFDIGDIEKLTNKYHLSLDSFFGLKKSNIGFSVQSINITDFTFFDYLKSIEKNLGIITAISPKHLYYNARDLPIFHYFQIPELGSFKLFFWLRYYLQHPALQKLKFDYNDLPEVLKKYGKTPSNLWSLYNKIPSTEIWTYETAIITIRQIEFAYQTGIIDEECSKILFEKFRNLIVHIQNMAQQGNKYNIGSDAILEGAEFNIYFNEVAIGDNSILFKMGERKLSFITYSNINYMSTSDDAFTNYQDSNFKSTINNSTLISATAEKLRSKFFNTLIAKIDLIESNMHNHSPIY